MPTPPSSPGLGQLQKQTLSAHRTAVYLPEWGRVVIIAAQGRGVAWLVGPECDALLHKRLDSEGMEQDGVDKAVSQAPPEQFSETAH